MKATPVLKFGVTLITDQPHSVTVWKKFSPDSSGAAKSDDQRNAGLIRIAMPIQFHRTTGGSQAFGGRVSTVS
jgi:hypothetical protein